MNSNAALKTAYEIIFTSIKNLPQSNCWLLLSPLFLLFRTFLLVLPQGYYFPLNIKSMQTYQKNLNKANNKAKI